MAGIVYVLTNPAMPNMVKIGKTARDDPQVRMNELYTSGAPVPFECSIAVQVNDEVSVEKALHDAFGPYRVNPQREFFEIKPDQAVALLRLVGKNVTPQVNAATEDLDEESRMAFKRLSKRHPALNFSTMNIPVGAVLSSVDTDEAATVQNERKVVFRGEEMSLSAATRTLLGKDRNVGPCPYWSYDGKSLSEIYTETYGPVD